MRSTVYSRGHASLQQKIINIRASVPPNKGLPECPLQLKKAFPNTVKEALGLPRVFRPEFSVYSIYNPNWLVGFVDGCF